MYLSFLAWNALWVMKTSHVGTQHGEAKKGASLIAGTHGEIGSSSRENSAS